jgi:hypothetical protein
MRSGIGTIKVISGLLSCGASCVSDPFLDPAQCRLQPISHRTSISGIANTIKALFRLGIRFHGLKEVILFYYIFVNILPRLTIIF